MLSKLISKNSKNYYRFVLGLLFISVGYIIATISMFVSGYFQLNAVHKEFDTSAKNTLAYKKEFLYTQTNNFKNYLMAVDTIPEFEDFLQSNTQDSTQEKEHIMNIMMALTHADSNIMQFRFIGKHGDEAIRIDRGIIGSLPYTIGKKLLQNKAERYYFKESKNIGKDKIWFSNIDLNMEHGEIVKPIIPTLRISKPYYLNGEFKGILIINIFMEKILNELMESELFHVAIIDKDSHILTSNHVGHEGNKEEWTRYLENIKDVDYQIDEEENDFLLNMFFQKKYSTLDISEIITNNEGLKILLEDKTEKLSEYTQDIIDYVLIMTLIVFVISFPIVILLSHYPLKLHDELEKSRDNLEKQLKIIDKYIYMTSTDLDGNITDVSAAYSELSGYSKDELIGKNHRILKSPDTPTSFYKKMWSTILSGKSWTGEIKNVHKNGEVFNIKAHITPILENGKIIGFTSIRENITDQKIIEEISIKDELTLCYNRRFFNQTFPRELKRVQRKGDMFCVAMFDIDYFKKYNDTYGHIKGDEVLQKVVAQISSKLHRASDYLFRVGGEEFIIIYSDMKSFEEAQRFSAELVMEVENLQIEHSESLNDNVVTISLGLVTLTPPYDMDKETILRRVDELLYLAKDGGRNRLISQEY